MMAARSKNKINYGERLQREIDKRLLPHHSKHDVLTLTLHLTPYTSSRHSYTPARLTKPPASTAPYTTPAAVTAILLHDLLTLTLTLKLEPDTCSYTPGLTKPTYR